MRLFLPNCRDSTTPEKSLHALSGRPRDSAAWSKRMVAADGRRFDAPAKAKALCSRLCPRTWPLDSWRGGAGWLRFPLLGSSGISRPLQQHIIGTRTRLMSIRSIGSPSTALDLKMASFVRIRTELSCREHAPTHPLSSRLRSVPVPGGPSLKLANRWCILSLVSDLSESSLPTRAQTSHLPRQPRPDETAVPRGPTSINYQASRSTLTSVQGPRDLSPTPTNNHLIIIRFDKSSDGEVDATQTLSGGALGRARVWTASSHTTYCSRYVSRAR
ncbi:hypothetical protein VTK26DRAFT_163 [Humicola hyalothermophila]